jgi:uncharacterized protein (DUF2236 family)
VLSALVVEPIRFLNRFGGRKALEIEKAASAEFYRQMGEHMGLTDIPADYERFERYLGDYERRHFTYSEAANQLMKATTELMALRFPQALHKHVLSLTATMMDESMRRALGVPAPPVGLTTLVRVLFRVKFTLARRRDPEPAHRFPEGVVTDLMCYPDGYEIAQVGPPPSTHRASDSGFRV